MTARGSTRSVAASCVAAILALGLGVPGAAASSAPVPGSVEPALPVAPLPPADEPRLAYSGTGRIPFTRFEVTSTSSYPYSTAGRLIAEFEVPRTHAGGFETARFACSGTVVESENKSLVVTAAHCLSDPETGQLANKVVFIPGYDRGKEPFGRWEALRFQTMTGWKLDQSGRLQNQYDVGAVVVAPDDEGRRLADVVGSRGAKWNVSPDQIFESFSYPGDGTFNGEILYSCRSRFGGRDESEGRSGFLLSMGCDTGHGGSGGGWIIDGAYLNSVTSYSLDSDPEVNYGPYLGSDFFDLYQKVRGVSEMEIFLFLTPVRGGYIASGRVTTDGFRGCRSGATVQLRRKTPSGWQVLRSTTTRSDGRYSMRVPSRSGAYAARVVEREVSSVDRCLQAISNKWS